MSLKNVLVAMGNPLLDISAEVPQEVLDKYDVKVANAILAEEKHQPIYQELVDKYDAEFIAGGAAMNSARVAQWMIGEEGATAYIGSIGEDKFGQELEQAATDAGVNVLYHKDKETPTGTCAVLIKDKERGLIANLAAAEKYSLDHLTAKDVSSVWEQAKFFYVSGFFMTVSPDAIYHLAKHSNDNKKTFAINLSAPFICQFFTEVLNKAIAHADIVFGNESEVEAYGKTHNLDHPDLKDVALHISKIPSATGVKRRVIMTQGSESTVVAYDGEVTVYPVPKLDPSKIVDVNGAGDAFVGGFLARLAQGKDVKTCVEAGHYSARCIIQTAGTHVPKFAPEL